MTDVTVMRSARATLPRRAAAGIFATALAALIPAVAFAAETDRLTVEDPSSGAVMFRVTSAGNVTGASFAGDGSSLTNVAHFKGAYNSATSYSKDDCVSYNGSTYIALKSSTAVQPDSDATAWNVFAQKGTNGADGLQGPPGPQGQQGIQGVPGKDGSPDTQAQILTKIGTQADNSILTVQQGPVTDTSNTVKFAVLDQAGAQKIVATPSAIGIGVSAPDRPLVVDTSNNTLAAGNSSVIVQGDNNKERFEIRSFGPAGNFAPTFMGLGARGTKAAPLPVGNNDILFLLSGFGWNGTAYGGTNPAGNSGAASIGMYASETHTTLAKGSYIDFMTTANGTTARTTRLRIGNDGNVGVGTTAPTQKLEVNGGVRLNTATTKPTCSSTVRGTFWLTQKGTGAMDTLEVCVKDATEAYIWKAVW